MTRRTVRGLAPVLLAALALTGCSSESGGGAKADTKPGGGAAAHGAGAKTAAKGGSVGGPGSGCELPVVFDLAQHWKAKAVAPVEPDSEFAAIGTQGPVSLVCEIDAKPAGHIGFLRVWQGDGKGTTARQALEGFVKAEKNASKATYTQTTAGKLSVSEVGYTVHSELMDESRPNRAFAVATPDGPVVVHLGGLDAYEHKGMLPAFELAKRSVRLG
ncbi:lipoprotein [Streptomyces sp. NPDC050529]|uniref:lipoprotein n=1 Tax=unclassified Streptomyces TaxID=2593676 RepID=UPI002DD8BB88|nr:lipoprotein [Streptomyces sp. NBC_01022]WRZ82258.1 lipoprotein [Streptomyces sp. NBC_01022]